MIYETLLLLVGGDETTRHVMTGGMEQLHRNPDQRRDLQRDLTLLPPAVEEMLRWVSPIKSMARTMTADLELRGRTLPAADKVVLLYESADFDEAQFPEPDRFDIRRSPNDHVAFGFGAHYCWARAWRASRSRRCSSGCSPAFPTSNAPMSRDASSPRSATCRLRFMPARRSRPVAGPDSVTTPGDAHSADSANRGGRHVAAEPGQLAFDPVPPDSRNIT